MLQLPFKGNLSRNTTNTTVRNEQEETKILETMEMRCQQPNSMRSTGQGNPARLEVKSYRRQRVTSRG